VEIVELSAAEARGAAAELGLLDAHASNMAPDLAGAAVDRARELGLRVLWLTTHAETGSDRFYAAAGWTRLGVLPAYSARPDGTLAGGAFYFREL
jgi:hypothetical protein